jgi:hypothetical protein
LVPKRRPIERQRRLPALAGRGREELEALAHGPLRSRSKRAHIDQDRMSIGGMGGRRARARLRLARCGGDETFTNCPTWSPGSRGRHTQASVMCEKSPSRTIARLGRSRALPVRRACAPNDRRRRARRAASTGDGCAPARRLLEHGAEFPGTPNARPHRSKGLDGGGDCELVAGGYILYRVDQCDTGQVRRSG